MFAGVIVSKRFIGNSRSCQALLSLSRCQPGPERDIEGETARHTSKARDRGDLGSACRRIIVDRGSTGRGRGVNADRVQIARRRFQDRSFVGRDVRVAKDERRILCCRGTRERQARMISSRLIPAPARARMGAVRRAPQAAAGGIQLGTGHQPLLPLPVRGGAARLA